MKKKLNTIIYGRSEEKLKDIPNNFFDGIITDPPYELGFMGKSWDSTGVAYSVELWEEVLRVSKPGSHLLCFGGTRTHHRVACAIEDAGWILRDEIDWIYGEGFPKSCNIGKQLDKEDGAEREQIWDTKTHSTKTGDKNGIVRGNRPWIDEVIKNGGHFVDGNIPVTEDAKRWDGYGTALKPAHEPIIVAMKPLEKGLTYAENAKKWNVAGLNIDGGRIGYQSKQDKIHSFRNGNAKKKGIQDWENSPMEPVRVQHSQGRWPSNIILSHSPDCVCITEQTNDDEQEIYACVSDCPIRIMDGQSGKLQSHDPGKAIGTKHNEIVEGVTFQSRGKLNFHNDSGGASRFFYCAKASRSERENNLKDLVDCIKCGKFNSETHTIKGVKENCIRNNHPTVKPISLMKYLLTLIKMPRKDNEKQIILDPFCGSGSTLVAAEQLGINYIGIDQDLDNVLISTARI